MHWTISIYLNIILFDLYFLGQYLIYFLLSSFLFFKFKSKFASTKKKLNPNKYIFIFLVQKYIFILIKYH